jgi:hypothetical protein
MPSDSGKKFERKKREKESWGSQRKDETRKRGSERKISFSLPRISVTEERDRVKKTPKKREEASK